MPRDTDYPSYLPKNVVRDIMLRPSYGEGEKTGDPAMWSGFRGWQDEARASKKTPDYDPLKQLLDLGPPHYREASYKSFKKGGKVKKTGVYKLHKGEKVLSAKRVKHDARDQEARDKALLQKTRYRRQG